MRTGCFFSHDGSHFPPAEALPRGLGLVAQRGALRSEAACNEGTADYRAYSGIHLAVSQITLLRPSIMSLKIPSAYASLPTGSSCLSTWPPNRCLQGKQDLC